MSSIALMTGASLNAAELLIDEVETRLIFRFFCPKLGAQIDQAAIGERERRVAQTALIRALDLSVAPRRASAAEPKPVQVAVPLQSVFRKLENNFMKRWWRHAKHADLKAAQISVAAFNEVASALQADIDNDRAEFTRLKKRYPPLTSAPTLPRSLCDALIELTKTADKNQLLNGTPFRSDMLGSEVEVAGSGSPYRAHFTHSRNKSEYDIQYIQMGWSLSKTYGDEAALMVLTGYMGLPGISGSGKKAWRLFFGGTVDNDFDYYNKDNLAANLRGFRLGAYGARDFGTFEKFVKSLCPTCPAAAR